MERVLITGATGFIGKELVSRISRDRYEVHALERYVTGRYSLDQGANVIRHHANLSDYSHVKSIIREVKPDVVLHLAAISAVSFSYDHPIEVSEVNYVGSVNLAEACYREVPDLKQFITAGTSEEYGLALKDTKHKLTEDTPMKPNSPYAVAKTAFNQYLEYMGLAYKFPYTVIRPFNTYGRKDNSHFFMERTITQMLSQDKVYLGDSTTVRDWVYVDDHVNGYLKALGNKKVIGETINICTGKGYTTKETADLIARLTGFKGQVLWNSTPRRPLDAQYLIGDNSRARKLLGWEPQYDLNEGLKMAIAHWRQAIKNK